MAFRRYKRRRYSRSGRYRRRSYGFKRRGGYGGRRYGKKVKTNFGRFKPMVRGNWSKQNTQKVRKFGGDAIPWWKTVGGIGAAAGAAYGLHKLQGDFRNIWTGIRGFREEDRIANQLRWEDDNYFTGKFHGIHLSPELNRYYNNMHSAFVAGDDFTLNEIRNMQPDELQQYQQAVWNWESARDMALAEGKDFVPLNQGANAYHGEL